MALTPLANRVIVKPSPKKDKIATSGIIVAATGYDKTEEVHGEVIAIGPEVKEVKVGDIISAPFYGYDTVSANDGTSESFMSWREGDILAIITN